jgi:hypothetical protein
VDAVDALRSDKGKELGGEQQWQLQEYGQRRDSGGSIVFSWPQQSSNAATKQSADSQQPVGLVECTVGCSVCSSEQTQSEVFHK